MQWVLQHTNKRKKEREHRLTNPVLLKGHGYAKTTEHHAERLGTISQGVQEILMMADQCIATYHWWACVAEEATRWDNPTAARSLSATSGLRWGTGGHHSSAQTWRARATVTSMHVWNRCSVCLPSAGAHEHSSHSTSHPRGRGCFSSLKKCQGAIQQIIRVKLKSHFIHPAL